MNIKITNFNKLYHKNNNNNNNNNIDNNNNNNNNNNNINNNSLRKYWKYWVDVQRGIVSSQGERDPL